jgi:hypothetical protein
VADQQWESTTDHAPPLQTGAQGGDWESTVDHAPPNKGFLPGAVRGSSLLSALAHPIDTFTHLTGIDEARDAKDAWDKGDHFGAAVKALQVLTSNPSTRIGQGLVETSKDQASRAIKAFHEGDYQGAITHAATATLPMFASAANGADLVKQGSEEASKTPDFDKKSIADKWAAVMGNENVREGLGNVVGNAADFAVPEGAAKLGGAVRTRLVKAGVPESLQASAEAQYGRVLNATTRGNKIRAERVIPELIDRGVKATSLKDLAETTADKMQAASDKLQSTYESLPEDAGVSVAKIIDRMKTSAADDFTIANKEGKPSAPSSIAEKGLDNVADIATRLQEYAVPDPNTGELKIPIATARNLRQFYDNISKQAGRFEGGNIADQSIAAAHGSAADAIRQQIGEDFPEVSKDNAEFQLWSDANRVVGDTLQRRVGQTKGLGRTMAKLGGQAAGLIHAGPGGAIVGGAVMDTIQNAVASPLWNTVSANLKNSLAKAVAGGRVGEISYYAKKVQDAQAQASANAAKSAEPPALPIPSDRPLPAPAIVTPPPADASGPIPPTVPKGEPVVAPESRQIEAPGPPPIVTPPPADASGVIPGRAKALPVIDGKTGEVLYYRSDAATPDKPYEVKAEETVQSGAPEGQKPQNQIADLLGSANRKYSVGGYRMEEPDPRAQMILKSLSPEEQGTVNSLMADANNPKVLGSGFDHVVVDLGNDNVMRLGKLPQHAVDSPYILKPIKSQAVGQVGVEVYPKLETSGITDKDLETVKSGLAKHGLEWDDAAKDNLGRDKEGNLKIIDGQVKASTKQATVSDVRDYATAKGIREQIARKEFEDAGYQIAEEPQKKVAK